MHKAVVSLCSVIRSGGLINPRNQMILDCATADQRCGTFQDLSSESAHSHTTSTEAPTVNANCGEWNPTRTDGRWQALLLSVPSSSTSISALFIGLFCGLGCIVVGKYGFRCGALDNVNLYIVFM